MKIGDRYRFYWIDINLFLIKYYSSAYQLKSLSEISR